MARTRSHSSKSSELGFTAFLILALLASSNWPGARARDPAAGKAMLAFKKAADPSNKLSDWDGSDPCISTVHGPIGVSCDGNNLVFAINLRNITLRGTFPAGTLGSMTNLRVLSMEETELRGPLPPDLAHLIHLQTLSLRGNNFTGSLPDLSNLSQLQNLILPGNQLSGSISDALARLPLTVLRLEENQFQGQLPGIDANSLDVFNVSYNRDLGGTVPPGLLAKFGKSAFLGDSQLCGAPVLPACPAEAPGPVPAPAGKKPKANRGLKPLAVAAIVIGDIFFLFLLTFWLYLYYNKKYKKAAREQEGKPGGGKKGAVSSVVSKSYANKASPPMSQSYLESGPLSAQAQAEEGGGRGRLAFFPGHEHSFDLEDLLRASAEMLGKGSFGTAYKAVLDGGAVVAVKRLRDLRDSGRKEFEQQMELLGKLRHPNLVPLKAYYYAREEKFLVAEYQPNGSVYNLLHGAARTGLKRKPLGWTMRLRIALGVARGLEYLHRECESQRIPHGNIKSSNILLDANNEPRISDYGLAPLMTGAMAAARLAGYRAPEYSHTKRITPKADVFSFGVLILELLTGRLPAQSVVAGAGGGRGVPAPAGNAAGVADPGIDLPRWTRSVVREEWTAEVFDMDLMAYNDIEEEMVSLLQIGMNCVENSPEARPKMSDVVKQIEEIPSRDLYTDTSTYNEDSFSDVSDSAAGGDSPYIAAANIQHYY